MLAGTNIRGVDLVAYERAAPSRVHYLAGIALGRARPGTTGRPAMRFAGAPLSGRTTRNGRRGRPARALRGGGRPDGGAPGRRSKVLYVPFVAPPSAARGPGSRRPVRSEVFHVPAITPFDPGLPANQDVLPEVMSTIGDRAQTIPNSMTYEPLVVVRRAAKPRTADCEEARGRLGAPASGRHRAGARNQRP